MIGSGSIENVLAPLPGVLAPPAFVRGAWRVVVDPAHLPGVMAAVLNELGMMLLLAAGEDRRRASGGFHAHYLCGRPASHELLHIDAALTGDSPSVQTLAALSFPASRFEREMRDLLGIVPAVIRSDRWSGGSWPAFYPLRRRQQPVFSDVVQPFPFTPVAGGVSDPVGPVHAG
jgi:Ni,Fe-hydrogenase III component G